MGHFVTGVTVVTTLEAEHPWGITVNALSSVSLEPALVMVALDRTRTVTPKLRAFGRYAVCILAEGQETLSDCFAGADSTPSRDEFCGAVWTPGPTGLPIIDGSIAWLECSVIDTISAGDHDLFIGSVDALDTPQEHPGPLLYYRRRYLRIEAAASVAPRGYQEG